MTIFFYHKRNDKLFGIKIYKTQIRNENINCIHWMKSLEAKQEIEELMHKKNV